MKDFAQKITACMLAAALSLGLCPAAALATDTSVPSVGDRTGTFVNAGATSSASTEVGVIYDQNARVDKFAAAGQIADAQNPLTKADADKLTELWVRTQNGTGQDSAYQQTWKRIDKQIPAGTSGADVTVEASEWDAAEVLPASDASITTPADNPSGLKELKQFNMKVSAGDFVDGHVYFYQATVTNGADTVTFDPIKIIYVDRYTGQTITENPAGAWTLDGNAYDMSSGLAAQQPEGSLLKGSWLDVASAENAAIQGAVSDANAAATPDENGVGELQTLKGTWNVRLDADGNTANDPLYLGDVLVTYRVPADQRAGAGESYVVWWNNGATTISVPEGGFAPAGAAAQVGYLKVTQDADGDIITFLIKGTGASLGAFGLAVKSTTQLKRFTVDAQVADESAELGTITPAGQKTYTVGDGVARPYLLNAYPGYQVKSLQVAFQQGGTTRTYTIPGAAQDELPAVQVGEGDPVQLGRWQGNQYEFPADWPQVDATLTVSYEAVPDAPVDPSDPDAKVTATLSSAENGAVLLEGAVWTVGSSEEFALNELVSLTLRGDSAGTVYVPESVTVTYALDGRQVSETYVVSGTAFTWKMTRDVAFAVTFKVSDNSSEAKAKHTVTATWQGSGGFASFDGAQAASGVSTQVPEGDSATIYITARLGWRFKTAIMGAVDLTALVKEQDAAADGTRHYALVVPSVTADVTVDIAFDQGAITVKVPSKDDLQGGTISPAEDQAVQPGDSQQFTITPAEGKDLTGITLGGTSIALPQPTYDANGRPSYTITITYDQLAGTGRVPQLGVSFADVDPDPTLPGDDAAEYTVTASVEGQGTVQLSASKVKAGGSVDVQMIPAAAADGQRAWKVAGVRVTRGGGTPSEWQHTAPVYTVEDIQSDVAVVAIFEQVEEGENPPVVSTWTVSVQQTGQGAVEPAGDAGAVSVVRGYAQPFTFTPDAGWKVGDVVLVEQVDGREVRTIVASGNTSASVLPVRDCTLEVTFAQLDPDLIDPSTGQEKPGNAAVQIEAAVEVQLDASLSGTELVDLDGWRDYVSMQPELEYVKLGDDATFTLRLKPKAGATDLHSSESYAYVFKGVVPGVEGAAEVLCQPIYQGRVLTDLNVQYTPSRAVLAGEQLARSFNLLGGRAVDGLTADDPFEAYQITIGKVTGPVKVKLVLQKMEDYKQEAGITGSFPMKEAGDMPTLYLQQSGPGVIGAYGVDGSGALEVLSSLQVPQGAVKRFAVVPNSGAHVQSAMLYVGAGVQPDVLSGAGIVATDVTAMARTGRVSIQMGQADAVLVVSFAKNGSGQDNTAQVIFDNPKASPSDTVTVGNQVYDVYTAPLTRADGTTGTARFYMTPKDGAYDAASKPVFTFHVLEGTDGFAEGTRYVVDQLTVNGQTTQVSPASTFVMLTLAPVTHFSVTLREAADDEGVIEPADGVMMTVVQGSTYQIRPSTGYMSKSEPVPFAITALEGANVKVKNVVSTVLVDGKVLYSAQGYDESAFEMLGGAGEGGGVRFKVRATGEVLTLTLAGTSATVAFDSLAASHTIAAETFRAVDVQVESQIEGGIIVPNGDLWWPVDEAATPAGAAADEDYALEPMQLYVAPESGYQLETFTVNGRDRAEALVSDETADAGFGQANGAAVDAALTPLAQEASGAERLVKTLTAPAQAWADEVAYGKASRYTLTGDDFTSIDTAGDRVAARVSGSFVDEGAVDQTAAHTVTVRVEGGHGKVVTAAGGLAESAEFRLTASEQRAIAFEPDAGYRVATLTDDGQDALSKLSGNTYVVSNVTADRTIIVSFAAEQGTVTGVKRTLNRLQSLATTGDLGGPALLGLVSVACAAIGVALLCANRRRKEASAA